MSDRVFRIASASVVATSLLAGTGCATASATRDLFFVTGGCLIGTGAIGGVTVGTSVIYDPSARDDDGAFVPVADQEGQSLLPVGVGIGLVGLLGGGALLVAGGLMEVPEEPAPAPRRTPADGAPTASAPTASAPTASAPTASAPTASAPGG